MLACSDNASVNIYDKSITKSRVECLNLVIFPPDEKLQNSLEKLYQFDKNCKYRLTVEKKSGISCNSTHNYQSKATGEFPSSYLKMQLNRGKTLLYGYYIDLKEDVKESDIQTAFARMKEDVLE